MSNWFIFVIIFVSFGLGAVFEWVYLKFTQPEVGILDIDDETNPEKTTKVEPENSPGRNLEKSVCKILGFA